jgi:hypothetical protein
MIINNKVMTVEATACLSCNEARYARNAVLGPYVTGDGPCPKGTRHNEANETKISTSKQIIVREIISEIIH